MREYRDKFEVTGFNHTQLDLSNFDEMREKLRETDFDVLINAAHLPMSTFARRGAIRRF